MEHRPTRLSLLKVISVHNCTFFSLLCHRRSERGQSRIIIATLMPRGYY